MDKRIFAAAAIFLAACAASPDMTAMQAAEAVRDNTSWPQLEPVTDEYILSDRFGIKPGEYDFAVLECPSAAMLSEIIVIRSDDPYAALEVLERRREKAIARDALYPADKRTAEDSVTGVDGDYAYFFMGDSADEAEEYFTEMIR